MSTGSSVERARALIPVASRLHHIGMIMPDEQRMQEFVQLFGFTRERSYYVESYQADCHFMQAALGGAALELIVPRGGKLAKFNRGAGGLHHVALEVDDLEHASRLLEERGVRLLEPEGLPAGPLSINFVPPAYTWGVIVELVQCQK